MNSESTVSSPVASVPADMRRPKRRRTQDERFEPEFFKRRAVSPGLSHSPILAASPPLSGANGGGKRLNFQGMSGTRSSLFFYFFLRFYTMRYVFLLAYCAQIPVTAL